jgi:hypothetical protein
MPGLPKRPPKVTFRVSTPTCVDPVEWQVQAEVDETSAAARKSAFLEEGIATLL